LGKRRQLELTVRDREVLDGLARRVHVFSLDQVSRTWFRNAANPARAARARLSALAGAGYLSVAGAFAHPEIDLPGPIVTWNGKSPEPDFTEVSQQLRHRWKETVRPTTLVTIQNSVAAEFGGYPAPPLRTDEITHDLHLAAVYLAYRSRFPDLAACWVGERVIRKTRTSSTGPVPDAMIRATSLTKIVEFGGAYSSERVRVFHAFCALQAIPYELW
jgi:hypothetical protein